MDPATRSHASALYAAATDPDQMRAIIEQFLRVPGDGAVDVVSCTVSFARGRGSKSLFLYDAKLRDPADGREWNQVVSGVAYGGKRTRKTWEDLKFADAETSRWPNLRRAAYVPDLDLLLQVFPFDHELPALEPLMVGPLPGLNSPIMARFGPGDWHLDKWQAESIRYRVDLRASVKLTVSATEFGSGCASQRRFFAKVYGGGHRVERAWGVQRELALALEAARQSIGLAPVVAYLPADRVLVQDEVRAPSLPEVIQGGDPDKADEAVRGAARAIAALHLLPITAPIHRIELDRTDPGRLRRLAQSLRNFRPDLAKAVGEIESDIIAGLDAANESLSVPVHGDLRPAHILFDEDRVVLLDLDKFASGEPMIDITSMLMPLRRERETRLGGNSLARMFTEEYFRHVPAAWERRLLPHYAWAMLREAAMAAMAVREKNRATKHGRRERRENHIELLIEEAHEMLVGRV